MTLESDTSSLIWQRGIQSVEKIIELLRNDKRLDWKLYLKANADVASFNMDPVRHYVYYGAKEGRPLPVSSTHGNHEGIPARESPILTVVISHSSDTGFLDKSVRSCIGQSCRKLEVVILAEHDFAVKGLDTDRYKEASIRICFHECDSFPASAEYFSQALAVAEGEYLLFISSGDFLESNVCENLDRICSTRPDVVVIKTCMLETSHQGVKVNNDASTAFNLDGFEDLHGAQIMEAAYGTTKLNPTLLNKAYNKAKFRKTLDEISNLPDSIMQSCFPMALLNNADSLKYIDNCRLLSFLENKDKYKDIKFHSLEDIDLYLGICNKLLQARSHHQYMRYFEEQALSICISSILNSKPFLNKTLLTSTIKYFGIIPVLNHLIHNYTYSWIDIASHYEWAMPLQSTFKHGSRVGIIYPVILNGGAEKILIDFANLLIESGHEVVMFLERPSQNESNFSNRIEIRYVGVADYKVAPTMARIQQLYTYIQRDNIDIMVSHAYWSPALLWETMLFHSLGLPYLVFQHSSFYRRLITKDNDYGILENEAALRCVDKLFVLSTYDEAYLRIRGIDAIYIPNPVEAGVTKQKNLSHNILFCGRLGEPVKQATHALQICRKLADEFPDVKIIFAGNFRHSEDKDKFYASISDLGLEDHVAIRGWQSDLAPLYQECSILLSTSFTESFGLSLAEAQANGLPCVIYEMPIMPAWQNESIISVPQGRPDLAAEQIAAIYRNPEMWLWLSEIAVEKSKRFSKELWNEKILSALSSFSLMSPWTPVNKDTLRKIIISLSFYACTTPPQKC